MRPENWTVKGRADFVTEVDREAERMIAASLTASVPGSLVMGEELSPEAPRATQHAPVIWIVDPLDGTTNFLHRFPVYAVSIAAVVGPDLVAGVVHHVPLDIRYTATRGGGAWQDGVRLAVSTVHEPSHALIGTGVPFRDMTQWPVYRRQIEAVTAATAGIRRPGSAALDFADVAAGRYDGFWELKLAPWDIAAGTLLIREAGGVVTDLKGRDTVLHHNPVVAGNPTIHEWLLTTLNAES